MGGHESPGGRSHKVGRAIIRIAVASLVLTALVVVTGIGLAAALGQRGDDKIWIRWGNVGQAFGVVNSVVSALAVLAVLVTWMLQSRDLAVQRRIMEDAQVALRRSADVDFRTLHVTLTSMAIDNPHLAVVWPNSGGSDSVAQAQHMYANLLVQHAWLQYTIGVATREELINNLRYLFASPKIRAFWRDTANSRTSIYVEGTSELSLATLADEIWREYEAVLACSSATNDRPSDGREWTADSPSV